MPAKLVLKNYNMKRDLCSIKSPTLPLEFPVFHPLCISHVHTYTYISNLRLHSYLLFAMPSRTLANGNYTMPLKRKFWSEEVEELGEQVVKRRKERDPLFGMYQPFLWLHYKDSAISLR